MNDNAQAQRLLGLLDLTHLAEDATEPDIIRLCDQAVTPYGKVAGVCVRPDFVTLCAGRLAGSGIRVVSVANFPQGDDDIEAAEKDTWAAVGAGADEVDLVFPYRAWLDGGRDHATALVRTCKAVCGREVTLKVILETGALADIDTILEASDAAMRGGADFLKTSTGYHKVGATLPAAAAILDAVKSAHRAVGLKVAGGIRTVSDASDYLELADAMMGDGWAEPDTFRVGASQLLNELLAVLDRG